MSELKGLLQQYKELASYLAVVVTANKVHGSDKDTKTKIDIEKISEDLNRLERRILKKYER